MSINAQSLDFPRRFSAIQFLRVHICQRTVADYRGTQRAFKAGEALRAAGRF